MLSLWLLSLTLEELRRASLVKTLVSETLHLIRTLIIHIQSKRLLRLVGRLSTHTRQVPAEVTFHRVSFHFH